MRKLVSSDLLIAFRLVVNFDGKTVSFRLYIAEISTKRSGFSGKNFP